MKWIILGCILYAIIIVILVLQHNLETYGSFQISEKQFNMINSW